MPAPRVSSIRHVAVWLLVVAALNAAVLAVPHMRVLSFVANRDVGEWVESSGHGFLKRNYSDADGDEHRYVVFVPLDLKSGDRPPIMLFLCGLGEYGNDGLKHLTGTLGPQLWDRRTRFPFVVVFPQCRAGGSWSAESPDVKWAMGMLEAAAAEFHTDPDRVYLTGVSSGGVGAWAVATAYPDRFAAVVPLCGAPSAKTAAVLAEARLPVWNFVNSRDEKSLVAANRDIYASLLSAGVSPTFTEVPGDGHDSWNFAYRNPAFYDWLLRQSRSKNAAGKSRFERVFDGRSLAGWSADSDGGWYVHEDATLIGEAVRASPPPEMRGKGESNSAESTQIVSERAFGDFELQFEFQLSGAEGFCVGFVNGPLSTVNGSEVNVSLDRSPGCPLGAFPPSDVELEIDAAPEGQGETSRWTVEIVPSVKGSGGLIDAASGRCLQPCDPLGQLQLKSRGWNDLRVKLVKGRLTAWLNNWKLFDYSAEGLPAAERRIAYELLGSGPQRVAFRNIRVNENVTAEP